MGPKTRPREAQPIKIPRYAVSEINKLNMTKRVVLLGRLSREVEAVRMVISPRMRPAPPVPESARPMMNKSDDFARAQIKDPISNNMSATRKTCYIKLSYG